jgi:hypothetical protein
MSSLAGLALALYQDGRLEVVATAANGDAGAVWHGQESSQGWSGFMPLGQPTGGASSLAGPAVARNADGRLEAVVIGSDLAVWHAWERSPGGDWTGWHSLGQPGGKPVISEPLGARAPAPTPALVADANEHLQVFVVREDLTVWRRGQRAEGGWSEWASLRGPGGGGTLGPLTVGASADGRLELAANDADEGAVWHAWQTPTAAGGWSGWRSLGKPGGQPAMLGSTLARNSDGRLELFTVATDGAVWHIWQTAPNDGWSGWHSLGSQGEVGLRELAVAPNADGRLVLFATEEDSVSGLWQREQETPGGGWSAWLPRADRLPLVDDRPAPGPIGEPTLILNADRRLVLFLLVGGTGTAYRLANSAGPSGGPGWTGALTELPG